MSLPFAGSAGLRPECFIQNNSSHRLGWGAGPWPLGEVGKTDLPFARPMTVPPRRDDHLIFEQSFHAQVGAKFVLWTPIATKSRCPICEHGASALPVLAPAPDRIAAIFAGSRDRSPRSFSRAIVAAIESGHPMRISPTVGLARYSRSRSPCLNSSNDAIARLSNACPYIVGCTPSGFRSNRRAPIVLSRPEISSDTEGCVMPS